MRSLLLIGLALAWSAAGSAGAEQLRIAGETKYPSHRLVQLRAEHADAKAALLWRIHPLKDVQRASSPRGLLEFVAQPGSYEVELLAILATGEGLQVDEARVTVQIEPCRSVPPPPNPPKPEPGEGKLDPVGAIGRIRFGNAGCTATVIGPRRADGRWDVLTAAHCVSSVGQRGTMALKDGRTLNLKVVAQHSVPDVAWCVTEDPLVDLPYALLAAKNPEPGTAIWHMGYGVDQPGNREEGTVSERENAQGQLRMLLSVSSGDSGSGIFRADTNELVAVVCCTSAPGRKVAMWGCSAEVAQRTRPKTTELNQAWQPLPIPHRAAR